MSDKKEVTFIKLLVSAERRILGYLVTLLNSVPDAEDLMQETSIVMWEKFDDFLSTQDGDADPTRFVAWGNKIAFYKVLNSRRRKKGSLRLLSDDIMQLVSEEWTRQDETEELKMRQQALASCLEELPSEKKEVLQQYYWRRLPVDKIASSLQKTPGNIYKILGRTRQSLHRCISKKLAP